MMPGFNMGSGDPNSSPHAWPMGVSKPAEPTLQSLDFSKIPKSTNFNIPKIYSLPVNMLHVFNIYFFLIPKYNFIHGT